MREKMRKTTMKKRRKRSIKLRFLGGSASTILAGFWQALTSRAKNSHRIMGKKELRRTRMNQSIRYRRSAAS
jgi:uncharacterized protein YqgV (UPF0045/DUF77 family)